MDLPEEAKRAPSAPVWNQSFPSNISYTNSYQSAIETIALFCIIFEFFYVE